MAVYSIISFWITNLFNKPTCESIKCLTGISIMTRGKVSNLRNLTRQQEGIAEISAKTKLQLHSLLDRVFPEYRGVFGSLYSKVLSLLYSHIQLQKPY